MRKITIAAILISIFLSGCAWFTSEDDCGKFIERNKMIDILTDVFMLEAHLSQHQNFSGIRDSAAYYYAGIFTKHDITAEEFEEAYNCYLLDEDNITLMMDEVLSSISIIQSRMTEKKPELVDSLGNPIPADSLDTLQEGDSLQELPDTIIQPELTDPQENIQ